MDISRIFERGAKVLANTLDGRVERVVWEDLGDSVCLCSERQFEALRNGWNAPMPIGFPKTELALAHDDSAG